MSRGRCSREPAAKNLAQGITLPRDGLTALRQSSIDPMGRGGDATDAKDGKRGQFIRRLRHSPSLERLKGRADGIREDLTVLRSIWFHRSSNSTDHASRLESFYKPQAQACARSPRCPRPATSPAFACSSAGISPTFPAHHALWHAAMLADCRVRCSDARCCAATLKLATSEYTVSLPVPADDRFRARFLHGRKEMLAAVAARLRGRTDLVWVDLGGGTGVRCPLPGCRTSATHTASIYR